MTHANSESGTVAGGKEMTVTTGGRVQRVRPSASGFLPPDPWTTKKLRYRKSSAHRLIRNGVFQRVIPRDLVICNNFEETTKKVGTKFSCSPDDG